MQVRTQDIEIVSCRIRINSQILDKDKWRGSGFRLDGGVKCLAHLAKPRIYRSILVEEQNGAGQRLRSPRDGRQGHRKTKDDAHHNATRSARRHLKQPLHDHHLRWVAMPQRNGPHGSGDQIFRALSRQSVMASTSNGFRSRHTAPMAAALASSPGSASAVVMITGKPGSWVKSRRLRSKPLMPDM